MRKSISLILEKLVLDSVVHASRRSPYHLKSCVLLVILSEISESTICLPVHLSPSMREQLVMLGVVSTENDSETSVISSLETPLTNFLSYGIAIFQVDSVASSGVISFESNRCCISRNLLSNGFELISFVSKFCCTY